MDYEEVMTPDTPDDEAMDDLSVDEIAEEVEEASESLDSILGEENQPEAEAAEQTEEPVAKEPGYVRGRIDKAVQKARAEMQAQFDQQLADMKAQFDAQMAPIRERMMEDQAQELVRSRKIADIETAREFVRMKNGQPTVSAPAEPKAAEQPRRENGQYAEKEDPVTSARISMLEHQAERIKADTGIDVTEEFINNEGIKAKVVAGEMDFYDVAKLMQQPKRRPPSPMRSPNGASVQNPNAIMNMTDEQFERMERNIKERGARYELK